MNIKVIAASLIALMMDSTPFLCNLEEDMTLADTNQNEIGNDQRIVLVCENSSNISKSCPDEVKIQSSIESLNSNDIVIVDQTWIELDRDAASRDLSSAINDGNPVLFLQNPACELPFGTIQHPTAFAESADIYGIRHDPQTNTTYCYSGINSDLEQAIVQACDWVNNPCSLQPSRIIDDPRDPVLYSLTKVQESFGTMTVESKHTVYPIEVDETENRIDEALVLTEYTLTADPDTEDSIWDNWIAIADMRISCNHLDSDLIAFAPDASTNETEHKIVFENISGLPYTEWSYEVKEASTNITQDGDYFEVWHDTDEKGSDKLSTKIMKPGSVSLATRGDNSFLYQETEQFSTQYYKDSIVVSDKYVTSECKLVVTIF